MSWVSNFVSTTQYQLWMHWLVVLSVCYDIPVFSLQCNMMKDMYCHSEFYVLSAYHHFQDFVLLDPC